MSKTFGEDLGGREAIQWGCGTIVVLALLTVLGVYVFGGAEMLTNPFRGAVEKQRIVTSGSNQIGADNWFHTTYNAVIAGVANSKDSELAVESFRRDHNGDVSHLSFADSNAWQNLQTTCQGQKSIVNGLVGDYNAKAQADQTKSYLSYKLPSSLPTDWDELKRLRPIQ